MRISEVIFSNARLPDAEMYLSMFVKAARRLIP